MEPSSHKITIGAVTIGQAPRTDITDDIRAMLSSSIELKEYGALDSYTKEEAEQLFPPEEGHPILVSRMRDGQQVKISEKSILSLIQDCILRAEADNVDATVLLCTGKFPRFLHEKFLIIPQPLLYSLVKKLAQGSPVGVLVPDKEQLSQAQSWFAGDGISIIPAVASPYLESHKMAEAAKELKEKNPGFLYLDCMGYSVSMKQDIQNSSGLPVILPRTLIARVLNELFE